MKKDAKDEQTPAAPLPWAGDEFEGQGGSFIFDPATKKRTRAPVEGNEQLKPAAGKHATASKKE